MKLFIFAVLMALSTIAHAATAATPFGVWQNPKGTILVRTHSCGQMLCGDIIWAGPTAIADAREAGITSLVGTQLLSNYHASGAGRWTGQVYVPDQGRRV
jgi:uncharacterized protein (DUF2147 family)